MSDEKTNGGEEFGPSWIYVDRVHFPDQRRLKVATLKTGDGHLNSARATLMIAEPNEQDVILDSFARLIGIHTSMLANGPDGVYDWSDEMMVHLATVQLYLERFKRPFSEIMALLSGERRDALIVQIISAGKVLDMLRIPLGSMKAAV